MKAEKAAWRPGQRRPGCRAVFSFVFAHCRKSCYNRKRNARGGIEEKMAEKDNLRDNREKDSTGKRCPADKSMPDHAAKTGAAKEQTEGSMENLLTRLKHQYHSLSKGQKLSLIHI